MRRADWTVLVPIKLLAAAKSRLRGAVAPDRHEDLVLAMAGDTVAAALAAPGVAAVAVVTADPAVADAMAALGARVLPEPRWPPGRAGGLNAALAHAATLLAAEPQGHRGQRYGGRLAALPADLPALRPAELAAALRAVGPGPWSGYVADAAGTGTVLLAGAPGRPLVPRFGPGSAAAHARDGARRLAGDWPTLRHDVDNADDLAAAARLGLGPRATAALAAAVDTAAFAAAIDTAAPGRRGPRERSERQATNQERDTVRQGCGGEGRLGCRAQ